MNDKIYEYEAIIQKVPDQDSAYIIFPYDIKTEFGKGRVKVHATFDDEPYDGSVVNMGVTNPDGMITLMGQTPLPLCLSKRYMCFPNTESSA